MAQLLALDRPDRVLSLVLISTSPATPGDRDLPAPTEAFGQFVATVEVDWSDPAAVVEYQVAYASMLAGDQRPFGEAACRELVQRDVERSRDLAAVQDHDDIPDDERAYGALSTITAPTLVIHGTADPMFPPGHGEALVAEIPGARFLLLQGAGHGLDRTDWETVTAVLEQTEAED